MMAVDQGGFWPVRSSRAVILAATVAWSLPHEGTPLALAVADSNTVVGSLIRDPNGSDTDDAAADWVFRGGPTPGSANLP